MRTLKILWKVFRLLSDPRLQKVIEVVRKADSFEVSGQRKNSWVKNTLLNELPDSSHRDIALLTELVVNGDLRKV